MEKNTKTILWNDIFRGFVIALGAVAEIYAIALLFDKKITIDFLVIVFSLASAIYYFDFFNEDKKNINKRYLDFAWLIIVPITFSIIFFIFIIIYGNIQSIFFAILLLLFGLLYDSVFKKLTRTIIGFKDFFVALGWNTMLWLFILYYGYNLSLGYFIFLIFVFSRDFVNASFCDLKDLKSDKQNKLLTIAELLREKRAIILFQITNCLSFLMIVFFSYFKLIPIYSLSLIIPIITTSILLIYAQVKHKYSPYLVDIEYFLWPVSILIYKLI